MWIATLSYGQQNDNCPCGNNMNTGKERSVVAAHWHWCMIDTWGRYSTATLFKVLYDKQRSKVKKQY